MLSLVFALHSCHAFIVPIIGPRWKFDWCARAKRKSRFQFIAIPLTKFSLSKKEGIVFRCSNCSNQWALEKQRYSKLFNIYFFFLNYNNNIANLFIPYRSPDSQTLRNIAVRCNCHSRREGIRSSDMISRANSIDLRSELVSCRN